MSGVPYHGWTHRPKADGGTDPIPAVETTPGSAVPIEWAHLQSTTNWGTSLTTLNFSETAGDYDLGTPTFDINGSNQLAIEKSGVYTFDCYVVNSEVDGSGTVWSHVNVEIAYSSGPQPTGFPSVGVGVPTLMTYYVPNSPLVAPPGLHFHTIAAFEVAAFSGTPTVFRFQAVKYYDGIETADSVVVVRVLVVRLGDSYS